MSLGGEVESFAVGDGSAQGDGGAGGDGFVGQHRLGASLVAARAERAGRVEWCLPKGHLELDETPEQAAVREIEEETGIQGRIVDGLGTIDYWFSVEGKRVHKHVHHYLLLATGGALSTEGDPDHEAIDVAWVPLPELDERLAFPNERRIAREASARLVDRA